jgi:uncharacterized protein DUF3298
MKSAFRKLMALSFALFLVLACSTLAPPAPTAISIPIPDSIPLSRQVTLSSMPITEAVTQSGTFPDYKITAQIPVLVGSDDPRVQAFNRVLNDLVQKQVDTYRQNFIQLPLTPLSNGSYLDATYKLMFQDGDIWSFKFDFSFYADTAAHPGLNSLTLNYDLAGARQLSLSNLFVPDSNYLETISAYCLADLKRQNPGIDDTFLQGASPTLENYRNWNITADGLLITFDTYQVAPGASGPQVVTIPYGALNGILDPSGPLSFLIK